MIDPRSDCMRGFLYLGMVHMMLKATRNVLLMPLGCVITSRHTQELPAGLCTPPLQSPLSTGGGEATHPQPLGSFNVTAPEVPAPSSLMTSQECSLDNGCSCSCLTKEPISPHTDSVGHRVGTTSLSINIDPYFAVLGSWGTGAGDCWILSTRNMSHEEGDGRVCS